MLGESACTSFWKSSYFFALSSLDTSLRASSSILSTFEEVYSAMFKPGSFFWHSSQRNDPGLNIALYTSSKVDKILEEARRLVSREDRAKKYEDFQKEVQADSPSIFLYSPSFIYILPKKI